MNFKELEEKIWKAHCDLDNPRRALGEVIDEFMFDYDDEIVSSPLGYIDGLPQFGRFKRNTKYRVYLIEVEEK